MTPIIHAKVHNSRMRILLFILGIVATTFNISGMKKNELHELPLVTSTSTLESQTIEYLCSYHQGHLYRNPSIKDAHKKYFKECEHWDHQKREVQFKSKLEKLFNERRNGNKNAHLNYPWLFHESVLQKCDSKILMDLKFAGFDINKKDQCEFTPLLLACKIQNEKAIEFLLKNIHEINPSLWVGDPTFSDYLPAHYICHYSNDTKLLRSLISTARENNELTKLLSIPNGLGNNALHVALSSNKKPYELAKILLENGADIHKPCVTGHTPIAMSLLSCEELLPWLIEKGANPNQTIQSEAKIKSAADGTPVLHLACEYSKPNSIKLLLERGADPNKIQENELSYGNTALHIAVAQRSKACVEELLKSRLTNVNATNKAQGTPLHEACTGKTPDLSIIKKLVTSGANIDALNNFGYNPLTSLCNSHRFNPDISEIALFLLSKGIRRSYECLHLAALKPDADKAMINFLLSHKWDIDERDPQGNTVLHKLINRKQQIELTYSERPDLAKPMIEKILDTINFLKSHGANENTPNNGKRTPHNLAEVLKKESDRDYILPRPKIKVKNRWGLQDLEHEETDYSNYPYDQIMIVQERNKHKIYIRIENTGPFMMQLSGSPIVVYKPQDIKRENDTDQNHNFSLLVDHYIGAGIYIDSENQNDPTISRLCLLIGFKSLEKDQFAIILNGRICDKPCKDEKLIPALLENQAVCGAFVYIFNKDSKTCCHRNFHALKHKQDNPEFKKCFDTLDNQTKNQIFTNSDPKRTPALLFNI